VAAVGHFKILAVIFHHHVEKNVVAVEAAVLESELSHQIGEAASQGVAFGSKEQDVLCIAARSLYLCFICAINIGRLSTSVQEQRVLERESCRSRSYVDDPAGAEKRPELLKSLQVELRAFVSRL